MCKLKRDTISEIKHKFIDAKNTGLETLFNSCMDNIKYFVIIKK